MKERLSTREAAKKLGVTLLTLQRHVSKRTIEAPPLQKIGGVTMRLWTARAVEKARKVLAATRPGRKKKNEDSRRTS
jgi:transposase